MKTACCSTSGRFDYFFFLTVINAAVQRVKNMIIMPTAVMPSVENFLLIKKNESAVLSISMSKGLSK